MLPSIVGPWSYVSVRPKSPSCRKWRRAAAHCVSCSAWRFLRRATALVALCPRPLRPAESPHASRWSRSAPHWLRRGRCGCGRWRASSSAASWPTLCTSGCGASRWALGARQPQAAFPAGREGWTAKLSNVLFAVIRYYTDCSGFVGFPYLYIGRI